MNLNYLYDGHESRSNASQDSDRERQGILGVEVEGVIQLVKPGVMYGNVLTGAAGFLLAAQGRIDWLLFAVTIIGMTLVVSSACALNNFLDRDIDAR